MGGCDGDPDGNPGQEIPERSEDLVLLNKLLMPKICSLHYVLNASIGFKTYLTF